MENMTFRARLVQLMQRSRKALRLYSNVERLPNDPATDLAEIQVAEWRRVNADLLRELNIALEHGIQKELVAEVFGLRDQFYGEWKLAEADLHRKQRQLLECAENGDFIKASLLSKELVMLKARSQACQAVHHELSEAIHRSRVSQPLSQEESPIDKAPAVSESANLHSTEIRVAKVIPLRRGMM